MRELATVAFLCLGPLVALGAQSRPDTLSGRVVGDSAQAVRDAEVTVTRGTDGATFTTRTDSGGRWRVISVPGAGQYVVFAVAAGRASARQRVTRRSTETHFSVELVLASAPAMARIEVRAQRRRVPALLSGLPDATTREEGTGFVGWFDVMTQGSADALLGASADFLRTTDGRFSLMGGPAESNQVTLGGIRMPSGLVTGTVRSGIVSSPWDVANGGAAGAAVALRIGPGADVASTYVVLRSSASGVLNAGSTAPRAAGLPLQVSAVSAGPLGRWRYHVNAFANREDVALRRWDQALTTSARRTLDSLAAVVGAPLLRTSEGSRQYGIISRLDLPSRDTTRERRHVDAFTLALTRTRSDGGTRNLYRTASSGTTAVDDIAALQYEAVRILGGAVRLASTAAISTARASTVQRSDIPVVLVTDSTLGAVAGVGGSLSQPRTRLDAGELRTQATWFSADNRRRYLLQLQGRYEVMSIGALPPQSAFVVASLEALRAAEAVVLTRTDATSGSRATSFVAAPAASVGFDIGRTGTLLMGMRADAWTAGNVVRGARIGRVDVQPRVSFSRTLRSRPRDRGAFGTLRGGVGRFVDWPSLPQWRPALGSDGGARSSCTGSSVPSVDLTQSAAGCLQGSETTATPRIVADGALQPVASTRGELSLSVNEVPFGARAELGVAMSRFERVPVTRTAYFGQAPAAALSGEAGRALLVDPAMISPSGVAPVAAIGANGASPVFAPDGRSSGVQYRLRLATRDPWRRTQLDASYAWNGGRQSSALVAPGTTAPGLVRTPATGGRHTLLASIGSWIGVSQLRANVIARSGSRFTPLADRDLNGDGVANDAAFVPADLAEAWADASPPSVRSCIRRTRGRIFAPNACVGPWSLTSTIVAQIPGAQVRLPRGTEISVQLSNPTALLSSLGRGDRLVFGSSVFVDPTVVRVTAFDADAGRFSTQRLGNFARPIALGRNITDPMRIAVSFRMPLGRTQQERRTDAALRQLAQDTTAASRARIAASMLDLVPNVPQLFLASRLDLTAAQRSELQRLQAAWDSIGGHIIASISPRSPRDARARERLVQAKATALRDIESIVLRMRQLFSAGQLAAMDPGLAIPLNLRVYRYSDLLGYGF